MTGQEQQQKDEQDSVAQNSERQTERRYEVEKDPQQQSPYPEDPKQEPYQDDAEQDPCAEEPAQEDRKPESPGEEPEKDPCEDLQREREKEHDQQAPSDCSREAELVQLRQNQRKMAEELQKAKQDWENKQKALAAMEADVTALEKSSRDVEKICEDYEKAYCDFADQLKGLTAYADNKRKVLNAALDKKVAECLDKKCKELSEEIKETACRIRELEAICSLTVGEDPGDTVECGCDCSALEDAVFPSECPEIDCKQTIQFAEVEHQNVLKGPQGVEVREAVYNALKDHLKSLQDLLKAAEALKKDIDKEEENGDARHYVLLCDLDKLLDEIGDRLWVPEDFCEKLNCAWKCLNAARKRLRDRKQALDERQAELAALKMELKQAKETRVDRILEFIQA